MDVALENPVNRVPKVQDASLFALISQAKGQSWEKVRGVCVFAPLCLCFWSQIMIA